MVYVSYGKDMRHNKMKACSMTYRGLKMTPHKKIKFKIVNINGDKDIKKRKYKFLYSLLFYLHVYIIALFTYIPLLVLSH